MVSFRILSRYLLHSLVIASLEIKPRYLNLSTSILIASSVWLLSKLVYPSILLDAWHTSGCFNEQDRHATSSEDLIGNTAVGPSLEAGPAMTGHYN